MFQITKVPSPWGWGWGSGLRSQSMFHWPVLIDTQVAGHGGSQKSFDTFHRSFSEATKCVTAITRIASDHNFQYRYRVSRQVHFTQHNKLLTAKAVCLNYWGPEIRLRERQSWAPDIAQHKSNVAGLNVLHLTKTLTHERAVIFICMWNWTFYCFASFLAQLWSVVGSD